MKLFYFPPSTYSQKVLIALHEKSLSFEKEYVLVLDPEQRESYKQRYPICKIPLLETDDEQLIPESTNIIEYLDLHVSTGQKLIPADPKLSTNVRHIDRMSDFYLNNPTVTLLFESWKPEERREHEKMAQAKEYLDYSFGYLNNMLVENHWLAGDEFSMADCAAIPALFYVKSLHPFDEYQHLARYAEQAFNRPAYQKVLEEALPILAKMQ